MTGADAARYVLDKDGLTHIKVKKAGFIRGALFGNYYNILTKTIYLRSVVGKIDNKTTVTSTALGVQKAAVARLCESGDKQAKIRKRSEQTLVQNTIQTPGSDHQRNNGQNP